MNDKELKELIARELITRELTAAAVNLTNNAQAKQDKANQLLAEVEIELDQILKMIDCDELEKHEFETVSGSWTMGSRFEEKCKNCGWIHTC